MPEAKLRLTIPESIWISELSQRYPDVTVSVLSAIPDDRTGVALVEITGDSLTAMLDAMDSHDEVTEFQELNRGENHALVQFETTNPLLLMLMRDSGVPLELPFELSDGVAVWEVTATHERISELSSQLEAFGIPFTVEELRYQVTEEQPLTESQQTLLETAVEMGYYETPRSCSLTEIAEEIGRAKSTVSETLHRAEGTVIKSFIENQRPAERRSDPQR